MSIDLPESQPQYSDLIADWEEGAREHATYHLLELLEIVFSETFQESLDPKPLDIYTPKSVAGHFDEFQPWHEEPDKYLDSATIYKATNALRDLEQKHGMDTDTFVEQYLDDPTSLENEMHSSDFHLWIFLAQPT